MLARICDGKAISTIAAARKKFGPNVAHEEFMEEHLARVFAKLPARAEVLLGDADAAALARITRAGRSEPSASAGRADAILGEVLDRPDDDALRTVLADALIENGDPRGELIMLQLDASPDPAKRRRVDQIIEQHREHLLGALDRAVKPEVTFARGFLARCALKKGSSAEIAAMVRKTAGDPLWATVEHIEGPHDREIVLHPVMRSLRSLAHSELGLRELASWPRLTGLVDKLHQREDLELMVAPTSFAALRTLDLSLHSVFGAQLLASPLAARLDHLELRVLPRWGEIVPVVELLAHAPAASPRFTLHLLRSDTYDWRSSYELDRRSGELAVRVSFGRMTDRFGKLRQADCLQHDVMAALPALAALKPARLVLARGFTEPEPRQAVERAARAVGAVLEE
jgi:uncharacterized protein (TIGR02996 family)